MVDSGVVCVADRAGNSWKLLTKASDVSNGTVVPLNWNIVQILLYRCVAVAENVFIFACGVGQ